MAERNQRIEAKKEAIVEILLQKILDSRSKKPKHMLACITNFQEFVAALSMESTYKRLESQTPQKG